MDTIYIVHNDNGLNCLVNISDSPIKALTFIPNYPIIILNAVENNKIIFIKEKQYKLVDAGENKFTLERYYSEYQIFDTRNIYIIMNFLIVIVVCFNVGIFIADKIVPIYPTYHNSVRIIVGYLFSVVGAKIFL